jgi:opacity protein-like surface antigen
MKKSVVISILILSFFSGRAQFLNSVGITGGVSYSNQKFLFRDPDEIIKKKYKWGFNGSVFAEFFSHDYVRWVSEIQYNQKGSKDKQADTTYRNKLQYLSWNNYLKLRYEMFAIIPYVLIGPRLEYNLKQRMQTPEATASFLKLHVSPAVGAGVEFVSYSQIKFFVEAFYNPDFPIQDAYIQPELHIRNINWELRVGVKYEFLSRESCNTPTYSE